MRLRLRSIRSKLVAIVLGITLVCLTLGFGVVVIGDARTFRAGMVDATVAVARVAADYSVSELAFGDREASQASLAKLAAIPSIRSASLYDASGRLFSGYRRDERIVLPPSTAALPKGFSGGELHVVEPVELDSQRYGTLYLVASTSALDAKLATHLVTMAGLLALLCGASLFFALRLERIVSRPILELAAAAGEISARHDYTVRVSSGGDDEVGILRAGFNDMLAQIEKRQRERDEADARTREKSQFLANMSHELRTPLNAIIGFSEILRSRLAERVSVKELKFIDNIHTSGQHLLGLVNDILDLAKVEAGRMDVHPEWLWVGNLLEGVCALIRGITSKRRLTLEIHVEPDIPALEADPVKIKQVLYNLLANAVRFSPENATVRVRARRVPAAGSPLGEDTVEIAVSDEGIGIDPKDHGRVFEEFLQAGGATQQREGTGLGLALVRKYVELHGGTITLDSTVGHGSTFTITLPLRFRGARGSGGEVEAPDPAAGADARQRVLVIEDDDEAWGTLAQQLASAGYQPLRARNGEEGLRLARVLAPAAITLDLVLPGLDGWDVLRALKADASTADTPVVIVSMIDGRELGYAFGADDVLQKPVDGERLAACLRRIVRPHEGAALLLVIDDDPSLHELLEQRLAPAGYRLEHALDGYDGLERARASLPDVIVLDLVMPGMDGFEVAMRLHEDPATSTLPVLLLTARDLTLADRERLRGKISALVRKGEASGARLAEVVQELLERAQRGVAK